jgi:hypothetical protein
LTVILQYTRFKLKKLSKTPWFFTQNYAKLCSFLKIYASTIYQIHQKISLARIGLVIVIAAIVISMVAAIYMYAQYQPTLIYVNEGESVTIGPVQYAVTFEGTHEGNKETKPENTFLKIRIVATNISEEETRMSGIQFRLVDETRPNIAAVYGGFSEEDLIDDKLEPGKTVSWTTQFDVPYDEEEQYKVVIRATKEQSSSDTAIVCLTNC